MPYQNSRPSAELSRSNCNRLENFPPSPAVAPQLALSLLPLVYLFLALKAAPAETSRNDHRLYRRKDPAPITRDDKNDIVEEAFQSGSQHWKKENGLERSMIEMLLDTTVLLAATTSMRLDCFAHEKPVQWYRRNDLAQKHRFRSVAPEQLLIQSD